MSAVCPVTEAIVLAGGLGTRLRGVVPDVPKPMAPVAGRPFLCYVMDHLEAEGIRRVILAVGYRHRVISEFFGSRYGKLQVDYSIEEQPLGTGGGIALALQSVTQPYVFVLNGDSFLRLSYPAMAALAEEPGGAILAVALRMVEDTGRYGRAVLTGNRISGFHPSGVAGPGFINAGVYLLRSDVFKRYSVPPKFSFETDFLESRVSELAPLAFCSDAPFIDIGVPEAFRESQMLLPAWTHRQGNSPQ